MRTTYTRSKGAGLTYEIEADRHGNYTVMLNGKVITVDGVGSLLGSTNVNRRSLDHDEEVMLAILDEPFTARLDEHFEEDLAVSERMQAGRWKRRPAAQRLKEAAVSPFRRFM